MPTNNKPNRLITEKSPYLLQHAHNPWTGSRGEKKHLKKQNVKTSLFWSASVIRLVIGGMSLKITKKDNQFRLSF